MRNKRIVIHKYKRYSSLLLLTLLYCTSYSMAQNAAKLYEETLLIETSDRDLKKAIQNYRSVIKSTKKSRLKAKAYLRIGICYDNLGNREKVQQVLRLLLKRYPKYQKQTTKARAILRRIDQEIKQEEKAKKAKDEKDALERLAAKRITIIKQEIKDNFKPHFIALYGGSAYMSGTNKDMWEEEPSVFGMQVGTHMNKIVILAIDFSTYLNLVAKNEVLNNVSGWVDSDGINHAYTETKRDVATDIKCISPKIIFKIKLSDNISQNIGIGAGVYFRDITNKVYWSQDYWLSDRNNAITETGSFDLSESKNTEGYCLPIGFEFAQGNFGLSIMGEYTFINTEGSDNLQWISPTLRFHYRF